MSMGEKDIHTVKHGDGWANRTEGNERVTRTFDTQAEAIKAGRESAIGRGSEHLIHGENGQIRERNTYPRSRDPKRSRG